MWSDRAGGFVRAALAGAAALGVVALAVEAIARSGGGQHYTGGGGASGGGGGEGLGALIYLAIAYPEIGVPVLVVVIVASVIKNRTNPDRRTRNAVKSLEEIGGRATASLDGVKARDPRFDGERFLERVRGTEEAVQEAWCRGDMSPVRNLLSDGLLRRFETQLSIMRHQGVRNAMADHRVLEARLHAVEHDESFDAIHVAVRATARDVDVDAGLSHEEALARAGRARPEVYTEIWSFLRRPGAQTLESGGAAEGRCPSCGGPLEISQAARCDHCGALVNSGEHDWVLAEITQPVEWRPGSSGDVPGLDALREADPGFSRQGSEDRASYAFWRWIEALVLGRAGPLAKCATADFARRVAETVESGPSAMFDIAVGSVDLVACEIGGPGGRDRTHFKVMWSSAGRRGADPMPTSNALTLSRAHGATGSAGLSHARCPACGAPLSENDSPSCEYCGADLSAGDSDWVLEDVLRLEDLGRISSRPHGEEARVAAGSPVEIPEWATPDMGDPRERRLLLMRMAAVVAADGQVTKEERRLLGAASKRWQVPLEVAEPILSGQADPQVVATMRPSNPSGFLMGLVAAALVDGRIDRKEERLLLDVGRSLSFSDADTRNLIAAVGKTIGRS